MTSIIIDVIPFQKRVEVVKRDDVVIKRNYFLATSSLFTTSSLDKNRARKAFFLAFMPLRLQKHHLLVHIYSSLQISHGEKY